MEEPPCLICHKSTNTPKNTLLTCDNCHRTWHHRCHLPPIPDSVVNEHFTAFLNSSGKVSLWRCRRCAKKQAAPQPPTSIVYVEELVESIPPPPRNVPQKRSTAVAEFIDLTDSPEARRPRRSRAQIDFEDSPPPSTPSRSASTISTVEVIDLSSDSPHSVVLELPDPPIPSPPVSPTATVLRPMDVDRSPASPGRTMTRSPTMSEIGLPDTPTRPQSPGIDFPSMKIDDTDQKPLSWLFGNLAVSDPVAPRPLPRPQGGSLGPAWIRESAEASSYMLVLDRYIEKQKRVKPLSRRKPEKTRFIGDSREPFIVLPFLKEHSSLI